MALSFTVWNGNSPGHEEELDYANNWSNGLPDATKGAFFIGSTYPVSKNTNIAASTWKFAFFGPGQKGKVGKPDAYIQVRVADWVIFSCGADAYLDIGNAVAGPTSGVKVQTDFNTLFSFKCGSGANDTDAVHLFKGRYEHAAGDVAVMYVQLVSNIESDVQFTIKAGTIALMRKLGGIGTMIGGTVTAMMNNAGDVKVVAGIVTTLDNHDGNFIWSTDDGAITARVWGGKFDASKDHADKTITHIEMHGDAEVDLDNGVGTIALTETYVYVYGKNDPKLGVAGGAVRVAPS